MKPEDVTALGDVPQQTTHFSLFRIHPNKQEERLTTPLKPGGAAARYFPLELCSQEFVRAAFGSGTFRATWHKIDKAGKVHQCGRSLPFDVVVEPKPSPAAEVDDRPVKKKKRSAFARRLEEMRALDEMNATRVAREVDNRMAFIQAEAERTREHTRELERIRNHSARERASAASASSGFDLGALVELIPKHKDTIAAFLKDMIAEAAEEGGEATIAQQVGGFLKSPGMQRLLGSLGKAVMNKAGLDETDPEEEDEEEDPEE